MGLLDFMPGAAPTVVPQAPLTTTDSSQMEMVRALAALPQNRSYPSADDVAFARKNDATYGTTGAGIDTPGSKIGVIPSIGLVSDNYNEGTWHGNRSPTPPDIKDQLYAGWLAAQHSPVATLGYDTGKMHTTPDAKNTNSIVSTDGGKSILRGYFNNASGNSWYDPRNPVSNVHEATHRGFDALRRDNSGPEVLPNRSNEETFVRALMNKHFGDAEYPTGAATTPQIQQGQSLLRRNPEQIGNIEAMAADLYRRRNHAMGPR